MNGMSIIFGDGWEGLGEAFVRRWEEERRGAGPFGRSVLALSGKGRGAVGWLKGAYLKRPGAFWANLEVTGYGAFVESLKGRREEGDDPWGAALLPWRIYRLLGERGAEFGPPGEYAAGDGARRWGVAEQVAEVLRGYQRERPEMLLRRWREGARPGMDAAEAWQAKLWAALGGAEWDGGAGLADGAMDGVSGVHVFAPVLASRGELALLDALSARVPVTVYAFNPCREMWTDDGPWKARRRAVRELLETGEELPPARGEEAPGEEEAHPLLGTWGLGLRATLGEWIDRAGAGAGEEWAIREGGGTSLLAQVQEQIRSRDASGGHAVAADDASVQLHVCHTPHREMEVLRDGIRTWLAHHPDATPADVLVLCGDYEAYVPHIDAVFGESAERLPYTRANLGLRERGGAAEAFRRMLALADDPLKATGVLDLLGNDAVARRFGLSGEDLDALRQIVAKANIHWGYDAVHVAETAGNADKTAPLAASFTWRRGLDRLLLGSLCGAPPECREGLVDAGALGWVLPMGDCEGDRAQAVGRLAEFVDALRRLAGRLAATAAHPLDAEGWRVLLEGVLEEFFREDDDSRADLSELHRAVAELCRRMAAAGVEGADAGAVAAAFAGLVRDTSRGGGRAGNAVRFEPLRAGTPTPARLVWVCGLNDAKFPRADRRPDYDLAWRHPTMWDCSARAEDSVAFLQALLEARDTFAMSHVGQDESDNHEIPPSGLAAHLLDYIRGRFVREGDGPAQAALVLKHRLQAFHPSYFAARARGFSYYADVQEMFSWSRDDWHAARALAEGPSAAPPPPPWEGRDGLAGFDFERVPTATATVDVASLADFFANPAKFVRKRWGLNDPWMKEDIPSDRENLVPDFACAAAALQERVSAGPPDFKALALRVIQEGRCPDVGGDEALLRELEATLARAWDELQATNAGEAALAEAMDVAELVLPDAAEEPIEWEAGLRAADGLVRRVRVAGRFRFGRRRTPGGEWETVNGHFHGDALTDEGRVHLWLEHLLLAAAGRGMPTLSCGFHPTPAQLKLLLTELAPVPRDEAAWRLGQILEMAYGEYRPILPFWPDGSAKMAAPDAKAWAEAAGLPPRALAEREDAMAAAAAAAWANLPSWSPLRVFWSDDWPACGHPQFEAVARRFWGGWEKDPATGRLAAAQRGRYAERTTSKTMARGPAKKGKG